MKVKKIKRTCLGNTEASGNHVGCVIRCKTQSSKPVQLKVASSFISFDQAELNLQREIGQKTFEQVCTEARDTWNKMMMRVKVEGGTENQMAVFYTALYRTMLFPRKFYEYDAENKIVHYSPYDGNVHSGYMFTDNGFWDTFRAVSHSLR